ncbi:tRNA adenosine deaminase-associated protein [Cryptosporangium aurantiacum]|uniref:Putative tRNA adenosine deaminase-associated protein n=1 Tax=Cryptosporangium aurantiacum TaxID=134849 RepID=A0A1M7NPU3_9ACTN|nr:tRNA adenosine deaminase-associated protein [Cryptosporangium aurantiacum]SHN05382.1 putative tRNA adenosine deaminase-associated protein [Cryptosporangium aurantiacum]
MSYFAAALVRPRRGWVAAELDLDEIEDADAAVDLLRELEPDADPALLFVEADDEFLVILRLDGGAEIRIFGSDASFGDESRVGAALLADLEDVEIPEVPDEDDEPELMGRPVGDVDLLADLGVSGRDLLALCAHEGMLPSDVMLEISRKIGSADALVELRGE